MLWQCSPGGDPAKGHLMSAMNTTGYGILSFSPNQTFNNVGQVCWDINATDLGGGKWTNVILVPAAEYTRHPNKVAKHPAEGPYRMDYTTFGFNADNGPAVTSTSRPATCSAATSRSGLKNFRETLTLFHGDHALWSNAGRLPVTADKAARFKHCMIDTPAGVQITRDRVGGGTDTYTVPGVHMPDGDVRVIFQDDNYDPPKRDGYSPANNTWHWDNIQISSTGGYDAHHREADHHHARLRRPPPPRSRPPPRSAPTTTTTAAPTTTTTVPRPPTAAHACPTGWRTGTGACRVPAPVRDHLIGELGRRRGLAAVASLEAWYAMKI